jgi:hypothetical protein
MTTFNARLTNLMFLLPQSSDCSCYVSRRILALPPLWLQKNTDLRVHSFAHSHDLGRQPKLANVTCVWWWRLCGISSATPLYEMVNRYLASCISCSHPWYGMMYFVNCKWVDTRWQWYSTHLHTNSTQKNTTKKNTQNRTYIKIRIHKHNKNT